MTYELHLYRARKTKTNTFIHIMLVLIPFISRLNDLKVGADQLWQLSGFNYLISSHTINTGIYEVDVNTM